VLLYSIGLTLTLALALALTRTARRSKVLLAACTAAEAWPLSPPCQGAW